MKVTISPGPPGPEADRRFYLSVHAENMTEETILHLLNQADIRVQSSVGVSSNGGEFHGSVNIEVSLEGATWALPPAE